MRRAAALLFVLLVTACETSSSDDNSKTRDETSPFVVRVVAFEPGPGAGFGQDRLPDIVLGPPKGAGDAMGSLDTLSLGIEGSITVELGVAATDGPGDDLVVFENAFRIGSSAVFYTEPGFVSVSTDGESFVEFSCDPEATPALGCAGLSPVFANADTGTLSPTNPSEAGGDAFDLADVGLSEVWFVRIRDAGTRRGHGGTNEGFDLDAIAVVE